MTPTTPPLAPWPEKIKNSDKTHCLRGHPLFGENVRVDKRGRRSCRLCQRIHDKASKARRAAKLPGGKKKYPHNKLHGMCHTSDHYAWQKMIARCHKTTDKSYKNYGARGITVCERWRQFENFFADMGQRPTGKSLERRNNDAGYSPDNCYWASVAEQSRNRRTNIIYEFNGTRLCQADWAKLIGVSSNTIKNRIKVHGIEKALGHPRRDGGEL